MASTTFIDTNQIPRLKAPQGGEVAEILNYDLVGAKNVLGMLHWLKPGELFQAEASPKHQLLYLMEGKARIGLDGKDYEVTRGAGVYLGPSETASIQAGSDGPAKIFHLVVPRIPR